MTQFNSEQKWIRPRLVQKSKTQPAEKALMCHTRISQTGWFWSLGDTWQCLETVLFSPLVEQKFCKVLLASSEEGPGMLLNLLECTKRSVGPWCPSWDPLCYRIQTACLHYSPHQKSIPLYPTCSPRPVPPSLSGAIVGPLTSSPVYSPPLQTCPFEAGSSNWWFQRFLFCHAAWLLPACRANRWSCEGCWPPCI